MQNSRLLLFIFVMLLGLASAAQAAWDQFQGNARHTGFAAETFDATRLSQVWSQRFDVPSYHIFPEERDVAIVDGDVFTTTPVRRGQGGYDFDLQRIDGDTGTVVWETRILHDNYRYLSAPSVGSDIVYVHKLAGGDRQMPTQPALLGYDIQSGERRFRTTHPSQIHRGIRPTVTENEVLAAGGLYGGFDIYELNGDHRAFRKLDQQYGWVPAASDGLAYIFLGNSTWQEGALNAIRLGTGSAAGFSIPLENANRAGISSSVMLGDDNDAYVVNSLEYPNYVPIGLTRFNLETREVDWSVPTTFTGPPAIDGSLIAIPDRYGLRFIDRLTGATDWTFSGREAEGNVVLTPSHAFVNLSGSVHAIDRVTRRSVWNSNGIVGRIAIDGNLLVISNHSGTFAYSVVPSPSSTATLVSALAVTACMTRTFRPIRAYT